MSVYQEVNDPCTSTKRASQVSSPVPSSLRKGIAPRTDTHLTLHLRALDITASVTTPVAASVDKCGNIALSSGTMAHDGSIGASAWSGLRAGVEALADGSESIGFAASLGRYRELDPVVERLATVLDHAEREKSADLPVYRDALCLAIVARLTAVAVGNSVAGSADATRGRRGLLRWRLNKVRDYVDANLADSITLSDLAAAAGLSRMHFAAEFRSATGMRPHDYILRRRIERSCELLLSTDMPIVQVALEVGFQTQAHFTTVFKRFVQTTPFRWRRSRTRSS